MRHKRWKPEQIVPKPKQNQRTKMKILQKKTNQTLRGIIKSEKMGTRDKGNKPVDEKCKNRIYTYRKKSK